MAETETETEALDLAEYPGIREALEHIFKAIDAERKVFAVTVFQGVRERSPYLLSGKVAGAEKAILDAVTDCFNEYVSEYAKNGPPDSN